MQIPILNGIYGTAIGDARTSYPRNMVPVPKDTGISKGFLRPAEGLVTFGTGPGTDRGWHVWRDAMYRVMGDKLVRVLANGAIETLGLVGNGGYATIDAGFDALAVWSGGRLMYWDGTAISVVTDSDLGTVIDGCHIGGYYVSTDGEFIIVTDLNDRLAVNPLKYGSSEADPDKIKAIDELRNELYAFNRYTIEPFQNVGGELFPFQRIDGGEVPRGIVGTHAYAKYLNSFAFVGSSLGEQNSVYLMAPGETIKIATREIDQILADHSEEVLAAVVVETRVHAGHDHLLIHLPDQTLVYDAAASRAVGEPVWFTLTSSVSGLGQYRARGFVWMYGKWIAGDPQSGNLCYLDSAVSTHYGVVNGWDFGTMIAYNESRGAIVTNLELVAMPGRVPLGVSPVVWTSFSPDGELYSTEIAVPAGGHGQRDIRIAWRMQGKIDNYRIQRFRGTSDAHFAIARLEAQFEPLFV